MNKNLKKFLSIIFVLTLGLVLIACGGADNKGSEEDIAAVATAKIAVTVEVIIDENESNDKIITDLTLPLKSGDVFISWSSNDKAIITDAGKVVRPSDEDKAVVLTASFKLNDAEATKTFELTVLKEEEVPVDPVLAKIVELDFTNTSLGFSYSSNNNTPGTVQNIVDGTNLNVVATRAAANTNHATYTDPFLIISASTKDGLMNGSLEIDLGVQVTKMTLDAVYWSEFDAEQVTKLEVQAFRNNVWVNVFDLKAALNNTLVYQNVEITDLDDTQVRLYAEGVAPTGQGNNGARILFDNIVFYGEGDETTPPVEPGTAFNVTFNTDGGTNVVAQSVKEGSKANQPTNPTKVGFSFKGWFLADTEFDFNTVITANVALVAKWEEVTVNPGEGTVTVKYPGDATIKFSEDANDNNAQLVGLDQNIFEVLGSVIVMPTYTNPIGLNKDGTIRLYSSRDDGNGNILNIKIAEGKTITSIKIVFGTATSPATNAGLVLGTNQENLIESDIVNNTLIRTGLNINSFSIKNTYQADAGSNQLWISSIEITYN